jgi:kynurenine formamidase
MNKRWVGTKEHRQRLISLANVRLGVVNLTEPLQVDSQGFPGDPVVERTTFSTFADGLYQHYIHSLGDHQFRPHGDAPNHFDPRRSDGFEVWSLDFVFNEACLIDLSHEADAVEVDGITFLPEVTKDHLAAHDEQLRQKGAVIIRTGYDEWLEANLAHVPENIPHLSPCAADYLAGFANIKVVGTDSLTVDKCGEAYAHLALKETLIVESLVNLYLIPAAHTDNFLLQTSPVAIVGATGGPVVAYAYHPLE